MAKGGKFYVVWQGLHPGVYDSWDKCKAQIDGFNGAQYKSFPNQSQAEQAYQGKYSDYVNPSISKTPKKIIYSNLPIIHETICVDAACSGNPGVMEYRGVDTVTGKEIFKQGPFKEGTNNIGEFLALVHGIAYLTKNNIQKDIYSDSLTAISWVREKKAKTKLALTPHNQDLFDKIARAEAYLKKTTYTIKIYKWETETWGEIPADFGRK
jgi:ribonuclease HI